jgi:2-methylcitrate dehydratase PrpD
VSASAALVERLEDLLGAPLSRAETAKARLVLADTIGCMIGGLEDHEVAALRSRLPPGDATEGVTGVRHAPGDTAMLLGFAAAAQELDEGHYEAGGHPAAPVAAAVLAEVPGARAFDDLVIRAFVLGYEAAARVGHAIRLRPDVHPHGTWGAIGAAVAVAFLRNMPSSMWPDVIDMAASLATPTSSATPLLGGTLRSALIGVSARNGLLACDLVLVGVGSGQGSLERNLGGILGTGCDVAVLARDRAPRLMLMSNFMKLEASCRETQGALATLDSALDGHLINPSEIANIRIETFEAACLLGSKKPVNATAARFSIPAVIAARLLQGPIRPETFRPELLTSDQFRQLCSTVELVSVDHGAAASRQSRIELVRFDGTTVSGESDHCAGDPCEPLPPETLKEKFLSLTLSSDIVSREELWRQICRDQ